MQKYQYINLDGIYYCQTQSLSRLMVLLLFREIQIPEFVNWKLFFRLFIHRIKLRQYPVALELFASGLWCVSGRHGYIVIDPYAKTATKIYSDTRDRKNLIRSEIEKCLEVSQYEFSADFIAWNIDEGWYQQVCLFGKTAYYFSPEETREFMRIYYQDVAPCLVSLLGCFDHSRTTVNERLMTINPAVKDRLAIMGNKNPKVAHHVMGFYDHISRELSIHGDEMIYQIFTHGDFHLFNMFKTATGMKLIDWEGSGMQSLMYDFYNYFFSHLWVNRGRINLASEITDAIHDMAERLEENYADVASDISKTSRLYLMLYYLERINAMCVIFKLKPEDLLDWVDIYRSFEVNRRQSFPR